MNICFDPPYFTLDGKAQTLTIKEQDIIHFKGIDTCFLVDKVYRDGIVLINSDTSVPHYYSKEYLKFGKHNTIIRDCIDNTGWMYIS